MMWLVGNRGMLGTEVEALLRKRDIPYIASDKEVDITDQSRLWRFIARHPLSWIINCSAYTAVDRAEDEPEAAFRINADGPRYLAEIAQRKGAKLVHISTDYVFDGTKDGAYVETDTRISWHDFACEIYDMARKRQVLTKEVLIQKIPTQGYPTKARRPQNSCLSKEKIRNTFSVAINPWKEGLKDFFAGEF